MSIQACGTRNGDYLLLENQWARVTVTRDTGDVGGFERPWHVRGDLKESRTSVMPFKTWRQAMAYALESLKLYQQGRAS